MFCWVEVDKGQNICIFWVIYNNIIVTWDMGVFYLHTLFYPSLRVKQLTQLQIPMCEVQAGPSTITPNASLLVQSPQPSPCSGPAEAPY